MRFMKRGMAVMLAALLAIPTLSVGAQETSPAGNIAESIAEVQDFAEAVVFNTGNGNVSVAWNDVSGNNFADDYFAEDGSYTIQTELNAFFPYEVQFICGGETTRQWFMTPDSTVEVGGHTFHVDTVTDGTAVTQMSLGIGGDVVAVYPEEKDFPDVGISTYTLLPIKEVSLQSVNLAGYTPVELTQVSVSALLGDKAADGDMVAWKYVSSDRDYYTLSQSGDKIDLSTSTSSGYSRTYEFIVGSGDQLDADAIRYRLPVTVKASREWLVPTAYIQNEQGVRTNLPIVSGSGYTYYSDSYSSSSPEAYKDQRHMYIRVGTSEVGTVNEAYISLRVNQELFAGNHSMKAYEGRFDSVSEAMAAKDITDQIFCTDMTQTNAGYPVQRNATAEQWITVVSFDAGGNVSGCLPFSLSLSTSGISLSSYYLQGRNASGSLTSSMFRTSTSTPIDGCTHVTYILYKGYAANATYYKRFTFSKDGVASPEAVTGAYLGLYNSVAEAVANGATDIKGDLFGAEGYAADYSGGVYITIIVGDDGSENQMIRKYCISVEESDVSPTPSTPSLSSAASLSIYYFETESGKHVSCYPVSNSDDSYGEFNFLTYLVPMDVTDEELAHLIPTFYIPNGAKLYAAGSSAAEVNGESFHDFTVPVQYTVSAEDGENAKNYWVQVLRATEGEGSLYINSLADPDAKTEERDGVIYSTREVLLDSYHYNVHDILLANMGTDPLKKLSVELVSDTIELDEYWTLKGEEDLLGFAGIYGYQPSEGNEQYPAYANYGELWNLAKIRLIAKDGVDAGTDVSGTLTIKSDGKTLVVLTLTGTVGDPSITTNEIPEAVLYVPYGTMIQNSNKYSWNKVSYTLYEGRLPEGMIVKPNGEIYGVPKEMGEFTFTVRMTNSNSYSSFGSSSKTYTLVVKENTDANVDGATDSGYDLSQRVQNIDPDNITLEEQTMVSQGAFGEFVAVYLDGVELVEGQDYTKESGSTRITIRTQTLASQQGTHTLGMEFRTQDDDTLKRAAQNYIVGQVADTEDSWSDDEDDSSSDGNEGGNGAGNQIVAAADTIIYYTVVRGDTLSHIARRYGISLAQLLAWNPQIKNPNLILPGQMIVVGYAPGSAAVSSGIPEGAVYDTVKKGDSLYKIAMRNGVSLKIVIDMNPEIAKQKYIYAGQKVRVK